MYFRIFRDRGEGDGIDAHIGGIRIAADANIVVFLAHYVGADPPIFSTCVAWLDRRSEGKKIAPAFSHLLIVAQAAAIARAAGKPVGNTVAVLVGDNAVIKIAVEEIGASRRRLHQRHGEAITDELL